MSNEGLAVRLLQFTNVPCLKDMSTRFWLCLHQIITRSPNSKNIEQPPQSMTMNPCRLSARHIPIRKCMRAQCGLCIDAPQVEVGQKASAHTILPELPNPIGSQVKDPKTPQPHSSGSPRTSARSGPRSRPAHHPCGMPPAAAAPPCSTMHQCCRYASTRCHWFVHCASISES